MIVVNILISVTYNQIYKYLCKRFIEYVKRVLVCLSTSQEASYATA